MKTKYRIKLNYLFLIFIFVWQSLRLTVLDGFDGKSRLSIFLAFVIFTLNILSSRKFGKSLYRNRSILRFSFFWLIYAMINSIFQYDSASAPILTFLGQSLFVPFVVMSIISNLPKVEIKKILFYMQNILYVSFLIILAFVDEVNGRLVLDRMNVNELSLVVLLLVAVLSLRFVRNDLDNIDFFLLLALPTYYIMFAGSRMAFGGFAILITGIFISFKEQERSGVKLLLKYFVILIIMLSVSYYTLEQTILGERLLGTTEQVESSTNKKYNPAEGTFFEAFGDRGVYYILSWELFIDHPWWGIGLKNFINYWPTVNHVELMIHFSELGIPGVIFYSIFNFLIIKTIFKRIRRKNIKENSELKYILFIWGAIFFSALVLFLYNSIAVGAMYGLILLYLDTNDRKRQIINVRN